MVDPKLSDSKDMQDDGLVYHTTLHGPEGNGPGLGREDQYPRRSSSGETPVPVVDGDGMLRWSVTSCRTGTSLHGAGVGADSTSDHVLPPNLLPRGGLWGSERKESSWDFSLLGCGRGGMPS